MTRGIDLSMPEVQWAYIFPDPDVRAAWIAQFGLHNAAKASEYKPFFTDPALAHQWSRTLMPAPLAGYLHRQGVAPDPATINAAIMADHAAQDITPRSATEIGVRACLLLVHPHLTRADRDVIVRAGLTLPEVDHLIATGTFDRDKVALLAGLTNR